MCVCICASVCVSLRFDCLNALIRFFFFSPSVLEVQSLKERESEEIEIRGEMSLPFFILMDATVLKWKSEVNSYKCTEAS